MPGADDAARAPAAPAATPSEANPNTTGGVTAPGASGQPATSGGEAGAAPAPAGRYQLGEEIARGGMGAVYRATDTVLGREIAVKVLQEKFAPGSGAARRFADEARITAQLQH